MTPPIATKTGLAKHDNAHKAVGSLPHPIRWLAVIGILLFLIAPWFTALNLKRQNGEPTFYPGWVLLFFGEFGLISVLNGDLSAIGWLANPCFTIGALALAFGRRSIACGFMIAAAIFSLTSFWLREVIMDEAGNMATVVGHDIGFRLWMTSIFFNLVVALLVRILPLTNVDKITQRDEAS